MTNTQLYFSVGLPTFTGLMTLSLVVLGWFLSRSDSNRLADKIDASNRDLMMKIEALGRDLNAKIDSKINGLRGETVTLRNQIHEYMVMLHERIVKVEAKQANG